MSYKKIRNEKGISEKRSDFASAASFSDTLKKEETMDFGGGCFFGDFADVPENGAAITLNMQSAGTALETREEYKVYEVPDGENDAECFSNGKYIFKKGGLLFCGDPETNEYVTVASSLPEEGRCAIYHRGKSFTVICENGGVFNVNDETFEVEEKPWHIPLIYTLYDGFPSDALGEPEEKWNMLTEYFYVKLAGITGAVYELPKSLMIDKDHYEVLDPDTLGAAENITLKIEIYDGGGAKITEQLGAANVLLKLRLRSVSNGGGGIANKIEMCKNLVLSPLGYEAFPSVYESRNNIILYGGAHENHFAVAGLSEYVTENDILVLENIEKVTSVLRYSENFLLFSPNYIRRLTVTEAEEGARFAVSLQNFKYDVGCDIPRSAVCVDDKIVYANSHEGVFYLNRFGFSEKDMSRHISGNVEAGENGFFACSKEDLENAEAVICDGKYFLRVGEFFYVWDFSHIVPSSSAEKASEERKLRWFVYSGLPCRKILGADGERIYFITEDLRLASLARGTSLGSSAESYFHSREYALAPFGTAAVWKLSLSLTAKEAVTVRCYFDGEMGNGKYTVTTEAGKSTLCEIRPEARKCRRFAFSLHSFGGIRLDGARVEWV